jgi:hypothetical protein
VERDVAVRSKNETATDCKLFYSLYNVLQIKKLKYSSTVSYWNPSLPTYLHTYLTQWLIDVLYEWLAERQTNWRNTN